jgi:hypothetical protein
MKLTFFRFMSGVALAAAVAVGCRSMYRGADESGGSAPIGPGTDPFGDASGFFTPNSHDAPDGLPVSTVVEQEVADEGEETFSHFRSIQIDPEFESTAGPKFVLPFDIDNDGMVDLLTGWTQSQPVQIHLQRRDEDQNVVFVSVNLGGTYPIGLIGGLDMADFNGDGWLDVVVAVKETGMAGICPTPPDYQVLEDAGMGEVYLLFSPGTVENITDGDAWQALRIERSQLPTRRDVPPEESVVFPEFNGYTSVAAGEIDGINGPDIVVAYNPPPCEFYGDMPVPINRIVLYANPGGDNVYDPGAIPLSVTAQATGPSQVDHGSGVSLDGIQSFSRIGFAELGPMVGAVNYHWEQVAGPAVVLEDADSALASFTAPAADAGLTFMLQVSSGASFAVGGTDAVDFDHVTVLVGTPANRPPTVETEQEIIVVPGVGTGQTVTVQLVAIASDPDGDPLAYGWTQLGGEPVSLQGQSSPTASFVAPQVGTELSFRVTVSDGELVASAKVEVVSGMWAPVAIERSIAAAGDVGISDVDLDGDNDVIYTYPDAITRNVGWARNPANTQGPAAALDPLAWETRPVGHLDMDGEVFALGDVDMDGFVDVLARSKEGLVVQWFRHPGAADREPVFPPPDSVPDRLNFPWQVYTIAEYMVGNPTGVAIGDLTGDGTNEVAVSAGGIIYWYEARGGDPYDRDSWHETFVLDDTKAQGTTDDVDDLDYEDTGTVIFNLAIVDIDQDGFGDVLGTFDRRVDSGLADDRLLWFRNTLGDQTEVVPASE